MAVLQDAFDMDDFINRMMKIIPRINNGQYLGKRLTFPFAHPDSTVEFSGINLKQELPGEVFELSYPDCPMECAEHEEQLRSIVRNCYDEIADKENGTLVLRFSKTLIRKRRFANEMSVEEVVQTRAEHWRDMKVNVRYQYMLNDDDKILDMFERLGAVKKSEETLDDELTILLNIAPFQVRLNANTMALSGIALRLLFGRQFCMPFPSTCDGTKKIFDGLSMQPSNVYEIEFDKLCGMCSDDATLLSTLRTPGLGFLSRKQNSEGFVIDESSVGSITCLFLLHKQLQYSFDIHGVEVVLDCWSRVNFDFECNERESKVHQRIHGREIAISFRRSEDLPVDNFVAVVARIISALKTAVQDGEVRLSMFEVVERLNKRVLDEILFDSPEWCLSEKQLSMRREFHDMQKKLSDQENSSERPARGRTRARPEASPTAILKQIRDGRTLEEMLGVSPGVHPITLRGRAKALVREIEKMSLDANGQDLNRLRQKLVDAAAERNLTL